MPKQNSVRWTGKVRLKMSEMADLWSTQTIESIPPKTMNVIWTPTTVRSVTSLRVLRFSYRSILNILFILFLPDIRRAAVPEGTTLVWLCGRWPRLVGGLWREVNYTVTQLKHSECGRICRGAVGEGGLIRGGPLYTNCRTVFISCKCV